MGGMGEMLEGMRVFTFKKDGAGSVRLGTANEPFDWQIEGDTLTRTARKTTAILKQRVMKSTYRIEGDKLILNESGKEIILRRK
jgi:RecB family endonuclease NucS|tara:strand:+ start:193 stop:444 length:252 start_codon:yes stop_codon:yes gene_type:complete